MKIYHTDSMFEKRNITYAIHYTILKNNSYIWYDVWGCEWWQSRLCNGAH